jgi:hypothetical protein
MARAGQVPANLHVHAMQWMIPFDSCVAVLQKPNIAETATTS